MCAAKGKGLEPLCDALERLDVNGSGYGLKNIKSLAKTNGLLKTLKLKIWPGMNGLLKKENLILQSDTVYRF